VSLDLVAIQTNGHKLTLYFKKSQHPTRMYGAAFVAIIQQIQTALLVGDVNTAHNSAGLGKNKSVALLAVTQSH
jgi:hypothetical protein